MIKNLCLPVLFCLLLLPGNKANGQVNPLTDQYLINPFLMNPAIAGTERYAPLVLNARQQWMGWDGAPASQNITYHTRLRSKGIFYTPRGFRNKGKNSFGRIGLGGGFFNYAYGAVSHTGFHLDYSYQIFLGPGRLSFGVAPLFFQYRLNKSGFVLPDPTIIDPLIAKPSESLWFLDVDAGMHYYTDRFYLGFSAVQLLNSAVKFGQYSFPKQTEVSLNPDLATTTYLYSGYRFTFSRNFAFEPSVYLKYNFRNGAGIHLNTLIRVGDSFESGLSYRWKEGFSFLAGVQLDNLQIRYLFEIPFTARVPNRFTSHSVSILLRLGEPIE
ncbi:MAG: type IX secretion system membrane protein PorP/SprF [Bacteroidales bacterium]|nr:type IX secretion system membrane protein PorP/SprF [Bacteroidales bacterium]